MFTAFSEMPWLEKIFVASAIFGGGLVLIRLVLMLLGGDSDADAGDVGDIDVGDVGDVDVGDVDAGDADIGDMDHGALSSFHVLSLQSISGFLLLFGLVGLAVNRIEGAGSVWAVVAGTVAGIAMIWILGFLMAGLKSLQSSGTLNLKAAVGVEGKVYLRIPPDGIGKVETPLQGGMSIFDARSDGKETIPSGARVKVTGVVAGNVMVVRKV